MKLVLCMLAAAALAHATTNFNTPTQTNGTTYNAVDTTGFSTNGNDMAGMLVTGTFTGGSTAICHWLAGAGNAGGCTAVNGALGFQLSEDGDTYFNQFNLTNIVGAGLLSLSFDGPSGFTMFDRSFGFLGLEEGTPGSNVGQDANGTTSSNSGIGANVLYTNRVATQGNAPVGDEFATVLITFVNSSTVDTALPTGSTASWTMDTDSIGLPGQAPGSGTPEPGTFGLVVGSLGGLLLLVRRQRRSV